MEHLSQDLYPPEAFSSVSILTMRPEAFSSVSILTMRPEAFSSVSILTMRPEAFSSVSILTIRPDPCLISLYTSAHTEVNLNSFISVCVFVPQYFLTLQRYLLIFLKIVYLPSTLYLHCIVVLYCLSVSVSNVRLYNLGLSF